MGEVVSPRRGGRGDFVGSCCLAEARGARRFYGELLSRRGAEGAETLWGVVVSLRRGGRGGFFVFLFSFLVPGLGGVEDSFVEGEDIEFVLGVEAGG